MNKLIATFLVDENQLIEVEGVYQGAPFSEVDLSFCLKTAFGWAEESGIYLDDYRALPEESSTGIMKILNDVRAQAIDEFAAEVKKMLNGITIAQKTVDEIADQLKSEEKSEAKIEELLSNTTESPLRM